MIRSIPSARRLVASAILVGLVAACSSGAGSPTPNASATGAIVPPASAAAATPAAATPAAAASTGTASGACPTSPPPPLAAGETRTVTITTPKGTIVLKIEADLGPNAAGNFVELAACGFYNGVVFHRLVPGFVIQGGDGEFGRVGADGKLSADDQARVGTGGPGYGFKDQPVQGAYKRGTLAMARTSAPDSQGSQFFIVLDDAAAQALDSVRTYAIFGEVTSGLDVVDAIAAMPNSGQQTGNAALEPVPMTSVTVSNP